MTRFFLLRQPDGEHGAERVRGAGGEQPHDLLTGHCHLRQRVGHCAIGDARNDLKGGTEVSLHIQRLQLGVHEKWIIELRHFAPAFAKNWQQPRGKWFVPFHGQARHVSDDQ